MKYKFYYLQNYKEEEKKKIDLAKHYHYQVGLRNYLNYFQKGILILKLNCQS